jgi:glycosyltransferase involved in cell wall biosynthesis
LPFANGDILVARASLPRRLTRYAWTITGAPSVERLFGTGPLAVAHSPSQIRLPSATAPVVTTIHDLSIVKMRSMQSWRDRMTFTAASITSAVRHSSRIIADSNHTKQDVIDLIGTPDDHITVVPLGVDHELFRPVRDEAAISAIKRKYAIRSEFVLYVGSLYSRKLGLLPEAFGLVRSRRRDDCQLVVCGGRESRSVGEKPLYERIAQLGLADHLILAGDVPEADLPGLMSAARAFVYVSLFEGFGLSPLEAMACGAPVVVSNTTSLPEVVGDAGVLVDPLDTEEIAAAISRTLDDAAYRESLVRRSIERAQSFSWSRTVSETLAVYERVAEVGR